MFVPRLRYRKHAGCPARPRLSFLLLIVLLAVTAPHQAFSTPVTATITGYVTSGKNCHTGTEGCIFGTVSDLTDLPFTLIYSYDDTYGTEDGVTCNTGAGGYQLYTSTISNSGTSNPGTAELTITVDDNDYNFFIGDAGFGQTSITSTATRDFKNTCHSDDYAYFKVDAGYGSGGYSGSSTVHAYAYPEGTSLGGAGDWRVPIFSVDTHQYGSYIYFSIAVASGGTYQDYAYGYLTPYTYSVSSPGYSVPSSETATFQQWQSTYDPDLYAPTGQWLQSLSVDTSYLSNALSAWMVAEQNVNNGTYTPSDTCNAAVGSGSPFYYTPPPTLSGGSWHVTSGNVWGDSTKDAGALQYDNVGEEDDVQTVGGTPTRYVAYLRSLTPSPLPCSVIRFQQMKINFSDGNGPHDYGAVNTLIGTIDLTTVSASKSNDSYGLHTKAY